MSLSSVPDDAPVGARSAASERLRDINEGEVILEPRKIRVYLELRRISDGLNVGIVPQPVVERVLAAATEGKELSAEEITELGDETKEAAEGSFEAQMRSFVASCITAIDDEPGPITAEDTYQFSEREFNKLMRYCMRDEPLPGKA